MIIQFPYLLVAVVTVANAVELLINLVKNQIKMRHSLDSFGVDLGKVMEDNI